MKIIVPIFIIFTSFVIGKSFLDSIRISVEADRQNAMSQNEVSFEDSDEVELRETIRQNSRSQKIRIQVYKKKRRLYLYRGNELIKEYKIALSDKNVGDKNKAGDRRTPEGLYYICQKNDRSRYYKTLGISYPNIQDAKRGLSKGRITQQEYRTIVKKQKALKRPSWNTSLGGHVSIIGQSNLATSGDWTHGDIALQNDEIDELFKIIELKTEIRIYP